MAKIVWQTGLFSLYKAAGLGEGNPAFKIDHVSHPAIGLMSRVFGNGPGDRGSIPGRVIPKT